MSDGPPLRTPRPADATAIVSLVHRCLREYAEFAPDGWEPPDDAGAEERMAATLARSTTGGYRAEVDGEHAGHVLWIPSAESERLDSSDHGVAYLWQLFVAPAHRRTGLAARLLAAARERAAATGYEELRLLTPRDHARARRFYEREGWSFRGDWGTDPDLALALVEYGVRC